MTETGRARQIARGEFAVPYVVATVAGGLGVEFAAWLPVAVMGIYLFHGLPRARRAGVLLEFADSFYYLGFTITVVALLWAADVFGLRGTKPDSVRDILYYYGVGLTATVAGVFGRTALQLFYLSPEETIESAARRIAQRTEEFLESLEALNRKLLALLQDTLQTLHGDVGQAVSVLEAELGNLRTNLNRIGAALQQTAIDPARITEAFGQIETAANRASAALDTSIAHYRALDEEVTRTVPFLGGLRDGFENLRQAGGTTESALRGLGAALPREELSGLRTAVAEASQQIRAFVEAIGGSDGQELARSVRSLARAAQNAQTALGRLDIARFSGAIDEAGGAVQRLGAAADGSQLTRFAGELSQTSAQLATLRQALESVGAALGLLVSDSQAGIEPLRGAMRTTAMHVEAVSEALREIAQAVRSELQRL